MDYPDFAIFMIRLQRTQMNARDKSFVDANFEHAPSLRTLVIVQMLAHPLKLPWPQLTTFQGSILSGDECLYLFACCRTLASCFLQNVKKGDSRSLRYQMQFSLDKLHTLSLNYDSDVRAFVDHLVLPALQTLSVSSWKCCISHASAFSKMLTRSSCRLETLEWDVLPPQIELSIFDDVEPPLYQQLTVASGKEKVYVCPLRTVRCGVGEAFLSRTWIHFDK